MAAVSPTFDIKAERDARRLTQQQLADFFHVSQVTICRWEAGTHAVPEIYRAYWLLYWKVHHQRQLRGSHARRIQDGERGQPDRAAALAAPLTPQELARASVGKP